MTESKQSLSQEVNLQDRKLPNKLEKHSRNLSWNSEESNPYVVFADADIELAAKESCNGRFQNCGQSCIAAKRIIVEESIYDALVEKFLEKVQKLTIGNPLDESTDIGPLYGKDGFEDTIRQVDESISQGATVLHGAKRHGDTGYLL